jgi:alginate O-acetyltransferase complex protein AlgI
MLGVGRAMLFNSGQFLLFFPIVTALYFLLPHRFRWILLLIASCYFYMAFRPVYILILAFTILVDYAAGIWIEEAPLSRKKLYLICSLIANVGVLAFFKYFNFLNGNLKHVTDLLGARDPIPFLNIVLPIGLSFHTFQSLSYTIEVYRGNYPAERHLGIFALYVMFYPQLVAGPIERPQNLLHEFHREHFFDYARVVAGLQLMLWGFFQKVFIADRLAPFVNTVYNDPHHYQGISLMIATVFFALQIFCDFSGYSDIARGSAEVMGFDLMVNFNRPYSSRSIAEFWKRWHISLSTWFRDYLYVSMGGNRVSRPRWYFNLFFTFLISGLWHGANWTYVIWGALNGFYLIAEIVVGNWRQRWFPRSGAPAGFPVGAVLRTFCLACFAWIFFRANNVQDAYYVAGHLLQGLTSVPKHLREITYLREMILLGQTPQELMLALLGLTIVFGAHLVQGKPGLAASFSRQPVVLRWGVYYAALILILFFGAFNQSQQFIYFQF